MPGETRSAREFAIPHSTSTSLAGPFATATWTIPSGAKNPIVQVVDPAVPPTFRLRFSFLAAANVFTDGGIIQPGMALTLEGPYKPGTVIYLGCPDIAAATDVSIHYETI